MAWAELSPWDFRRSDKKAPLGPIGPIGAQGGPIRAHDHCPFSWASRASPRTRAQFHRGIRG